MAFAHLRRDPLLMLLGPGESGVGSGRLGVAGDGNDHRGIRCDVHLEAGGGAGSASQEREGGGGAATCSVIKNTRDSADGVQNALTKCTRLPFTSAIHACHSHVHTARPQCTSVYVCTRPPRRVCSTCLLAVVLVLGDHGQGAGADHADPDKNHEPEGGQGEVERGA